MRDLQKTGVGGLFITKIRSSFLAAEYSTCYYSGICLSYVAVEFRGASVALRET